jgi:hypothetical protein
MNENLEICELEKLDSDNEDGINKLVSLFLYRYRFLDCLYCPESTRGPSPETRDYTTSFLLGAGPHYDWLTDYWMIDYWMTDYSLNDYAG